MSKAGHFEPYVPADPGARLGTARRVLAAGLTAVVCVSALFPGAITAVDGRLRAVVAPSLTAADEEMTGQAQPAYGISSDRGVQLRLMWCRTMPVAAGALALCWRGQVPGGFIGPRGGRSG